MQAYMWGQTKHPTITTPAHITTQSHTCKGEVVRGFVRIPRENLYFSNQHLCILRCLKIIKMV